MSDGTELSGAVEVFARAFALLKSRHHPYLAEQVDGTWILKDGPGRKDPRKSEVFACQRDPGEVVEIVRKNDPGWHFVCDIRPSSDDLATVRAAYKERGYRALSTGWLYAHNLEEIPNFQSVPPARQVESVEELARITQSCSQWRKLYSGARLFGVWDDKRDYGWVESIPIVESAYVCGLYVYAEFRRNGYGSALMSALLEADKKHGAKASILVASSSGAKLYPLLGYKEIAIMQTFCPRER